MQPVPDPVSRVLPLAVLHRALVEVGADARGFLRRTGRLREMADIYDRPKQLEYELPTDASINHAVVGKRLPATRLYSEDPRAFWRSEFDQYHLQRALLERAIADALRQVSATRWALDEERVPPIDRTSTQIAQALNQLREAIPSRSEFDILPPIELLTDFERRIEAAVAAVDGWRPRIRALYAVERADGSFIIDLSMQGASAVATASRKRGRVDKPLTKEQQAAGKSYVETYVRELAAEPDEPDGARGRAAVRKPPRGRNRQYSRVYKALRAAVESGESSVYAKLSDVPIRKTWIRYAQAYLSRLDSSLDNRESEAGLPMLGASIIRASDRAADFESDRSD